MSLLSQLIYVFCIWSHLTALNLATTDSNSTIVESKNNICQRNVTYYEEVAINKTREVEQKPSGVFKVFKKSKIYVETYLDMMEVPRTRLINDCCEGYTLAENKSCEPVCQPDCPANAFCRAPQLCQCRRGYDTIKSAENGTHYCEPRCASGCPYGGKCIAPDQCECAAGYRAVPDGCVPTCASDCLNGRCTALNQCSCNAEYARNEVTGECVPLAECGVAGVMCEDVTSSTTDTTTADTTNAVTNQMNEQASEELVAIDFDIKSRAGGRDEVVDDDYMLFPSNEAEANCTLQPCIDNTICKLVGQCACADGFIRYQPAPVNGTEVGPICAAVVEQGEPLNDDGTVGWVAIFFIVLSVVLILGAVALLSLKMWRHNRSSLDVGVKSEMCCKYDKNSSSSDSGHVNMC